MGRRLGFTLIEVVVAMAILLIVVLALVSSYSFYYGRTVQLRAATIGQNLAQLNMEDVRSKSKSVLAELVQGANVRVVNYIDPTSTPPLVDTNPDSFVYDSGRVPGTFQIPDITSITISTLTQHPAGDPSAIPSGVQLPSGVIDLGPAGPSYVTYTMVLMKSVFPGYERHIVIKELSPVRPGNDELNTFDITVTVYWTFAGKTRSYTVSTEK